MRSGALKSSNDPVRRAFHTEIPPLGTVRQFKDEDKKRVHLQRDQNHSVRPVSGDDLMSDGSHEAREPQLGLRQKPCVDGL